MSSFGDDSNPFARPSPWPGRPSAPMRVTLPPKPASAPQAASEPEPEPTSPTTASAEATAPRFIVVDAPVLARAPPPQPLAPEAPPAAVVEPTLPRAVQAPPGLALDEPAPPVAEPQRPLAAEPAPFARSVRRPHLRRKRASASHLRLVPLAGAAIAAAAAVGVLAVLVGREPSGAATQTRTAGLAPGQMVAAVATLEPSTRTPQPIGVPRAATPPTPAASPAPRVAVALIRNTARPAAAPVRLDLPALAPAASVAPAPARELAAAPPPPVTAAPPQPTQPVAPAYTSPAPPAADAPFVRHAPDPN